MVQRERHAAEFLVRLIDADRERHIDRLHPRRVKQGVCDLGHARCSSLAVAAYDDGDALLRLIVCLVVREQDGEEAALVVAYLGVEPQAQALYHFAGDLELARIFLPDFIEGRDGQLGHMAHAREKRLHMEAETEDELFLELHLQMMAREVEELDGGVDDFGGNDLAERAKIRPFADILREPVKVRLDVLLERVVDEIGVQPLAAERQQLVLQIVVEIRRRL